MNQNLKNFGNYYPVTQVLFKFAEIKYKQCNLCLKSQKLKEVCSEFDTV